MPPFPTRRLQLPLQVLLSLSLASAVLADIDPAKLAPIRPDMEAAIAASQAAGLVTLVMEKGRVIHHEAAGMADIGAARPMEKDSVFWIASMTKSVNGTALMILVDEGKVTLDDPASKWLPELAGVKMADGSPPKTAITLRMLLSHTAGIAFPRRAPSDGAISLKAYVAGLLKTPLAFEPGSSYEYGFGPTVAGRLLEVVSGMKYDQFLQQRIFGPLAMKDTMFNPDDARRARLARTYKLHEDAKTLVPAYNPFVTSSADVTHMVEPAGGLFSTAADMGRFYAMVANGGELDGVRILSEKAVKDMTTPVRAGGKEINYACGWQCNTATARVAKEMPVGTFGHGGAFATHGWVDPVHKIATVFMVQNVLVPGGKGKDAFQRIVMDAAGIQVPAPAPAKKAR